VSAATIIPQALTDCQKKPALGFSTPRQDLDVLSRMEVFGEGNVFLPLSTSDTHLSKQF